MNNNKTLGGLNLHFFCLHTFFLLIWLSMLTNHFTNYNVILQLLLKILSYFNILFLFLWLVIVKF